MSITFHEETMFTFGPDRGSSAIDTSPETAPSRDISSEDLGSGSAGPVSGNAVVGDWRGVAWEGVAVMCAGRAVGRVVVDMGCGSDVGAGDPGDGSMGDCEVVAWATAAVLDTGVSAAE